jgi:tubulin--tyrosine ligase
VDLLLSFPAQGEPTGSKLPKPIVTLLEFNASPDYFQSGDRLRSELAEMFKGVVQMVVAPFFNLTTIQDQELAEDDSSSHTNTSGAWKLIGEEKTRGDW